LRANPHRLDLARIGLVLPEGGGFRQPAPAELGSARQVLDLWTAVVTSAVTVAGLLVRVTTACHPELDVLAVRVESEVPVGVRIAFPYGSTSWSNAADWTREDAHTTDVTPTTAGALVDRRFDGGGDPAYRVRLPPTAPSAAPESTSWWWQAPARYSN
jgi:hypothetical protein